MVDSRDAILSGVKAAHALHLDFGVREALSRGLVRRVLRGQRSDVFRVRESSLEHHLPWLDAQWAAGHHNGADLWRRLKVLGFRGSVRVVTEWATRRRRAEKADATSLHRVPSARTIARLMTTGRDTLSKSETVTIAAIEDGVPLLVEAREVVAAFHAMIRKKAHADLDPWLERARASLVASFANGCEMAETKDEVGAEGWRKLGLVSAASRISSDVGARGSDPRGNHRSRCRPRRSPRALLRPLHRCAD
jgi:transposase